MRTFSFYSIFHNFTL